VAAPRVVAIDWSGRSGPAQRRALWLGEARDGELVRLASGRTRDELVALLIAEAERDSHLVVGLDFAFSLPAWYLRERGLSARTLWSTLAAEALTPAMRRIGLAAWMNRPEPPFWTTREGHTLLAGRQPFRRTELEIRRPGVQPKSAFQLVGAGQVGRGSLHGMKALHRLAAAGFHVWPFEPAGLPLVVEIYPRVLTGPVVKSSGPARTDYLATQPMRPDLKAVAAAGEDAFDAAVSALAMARVAHGFSALHNEPDHRVEGKIWKPMAVSNQPLSGRQRPGSRGRAIRAVVCGSPGCQLSANAGLPAGAPLRSVCSTVTATTMAASTSAAATTNASR
jgi:hypothetical protein